MNALQIDVKRTVEETKTAIETIKPEQFSAENQEQVITLLKSLDFRLCMLQSSLWLQGA